MASEQNFSDRLSSLLKHGNKGKLALHCAVEASTVSRWLSGQTIPVGETLFKIADFLGVDAKWLMHGESASSFENPKHPSPAETACDAIRNPLTPHQQSAENVLNDDVAQYRTARPETMEERLTRVEKSLARMQIIFDDLAEAFRRNSHPPNT